MLVTFTPGLRKMEGKEKKGPEEEEEEEEEEQEVVVEEEKVEQVIDKVEEQGKNHGDQSKAVGGKGKEGTFLCHQVRSAETAWRDEEGDQTLFQ
ncbi:uncharacterized protein L199_002949 [Kwoniella botswanensis]|uniref:uncharacterized protein n=1 Tax=Kwoniella botswanensis TaxID=1268659 RepID=UPI00315D24BD